MSPSSSTPLRYLTIALLLGASTLTTPATATPDSILVPDYYCYCGAIFHQWHGMSFLERCCLENGGTIKGTVDDVLEECLNPEDKKGFTECCSRLGGGTETLDCKQ